MRPSSRPLQDHATPGGDAHAGAAHSWLVCRSGSHHFAVPISQVIETMRMLPVEPVAGSLPLELGLCTIRGAPVPVVDAGRLFEDKPTQSRRMITIRMGDRIVAFAVETILGIESFAPEALEALTPLLADVETIAAIAKRDEALVFFLRMARLIPADPAAAEISNRGQA